VAARGLHKLVQDGVIRMAYGAIEVRDRDGLRSAAGL
jgi:hypothetical protein